MTTAIEETLQDFFAKEAKIRLALLIGSFAKGTARPDSDVDVAALFESPPDFMDVLDLRERLSEILGREADLVVLNDCSPIIGMQALKTGIVLFSRDRAYEEFFVRTLNEYDDLKRLRAPIEEAVLRRRIYA